MEIKKAMLERLNRQINHELYSSYLYLSMAAFFETLNLKGFANWMKKQAIEENEHAMRFYAFVNDRGGKVVLEPIPKPPSEWKTPLAVFNEAYAHEMTITEKINKLVDFARKQRDTAAEVMLSWFVTEQVEEEANTSDVVEKLKMAGYSKGALLYIDKALAKRE